MQTNSLKSYTWILHILLWSGVILSDYLIGKEDQVAMLSKIISKDLFLLVIFYFNYFILVPSFLNRGKILIYSISVMCLTMFTYFCVYYGLLIYWKISDYNLYNFISNYLSNIDTTIVYIVMSIFARSYMDLRKVLEREFRLRHQKVQVELNYLKLQLNPHFLFNNLNNVYSLCVNKDESAPLMVTRLSEMMRNYVNYSKLYKISLDKEIDTINNFISIQKLKKPMSSNIDVYVEGDVSDYQITPLILVNFVENAFKHSDIFHSEESFISISCVLDESMNLKFSVENSVFEYKNHKSMGIGNTNIKRQLDLAYGDRFSLDQKIENGCYSVKLNIMAKQ